MDSSFQLYSEWIKARKKQETTPPVTLRVSGSSLKSVVKWQSLVASSFKINVDIFVCPGA